MTDDRMALMEALQKADDGNFLRALAETVLQILMEADVEGVIGAGRYERSGERTTWRNGYRERTLDTRLGSLNLKIPKLRAGSYFPPFLEARKTAERALVAVIQEAWIAGVSTRRVDDLVQAMGLSGISKSQVSKLCNEIDERVLAFLKRSLCGEWPYLWADVVGSRDRTHAVQPPRNRRDNPDRRAQALLRKRLRPFQEADPADRNQHRAVRLHQPRPDLGRERDHRRPRPGRGRQSPRPEHRSHAAPVPSRRRPASGLRARRQQARAQRRLGPRDARHRAAGPRRLKVRGPAARLRPSGACGRDRARLRDLECSIQTSPRAAQ